MLRSIDADFTRTLDELGSLVAIPGIAWDSFDPAELDACARRVESLIRDTGFDDVEILRATRPDGRPGAPGIIARRPAPEGRPTVLLYAHMDVQPPGERDLWNTEPFEATRVGDRIFGRGAADDKAGIMAHLAAVRALRDELDVGVTLFFEGEEEAGSPSFRNFLETYRDRLAADVIVVADSGNWTTEVPALTTTLRGLASLEFEVATLDHAVHSGMYGGPVPDAATAMIRLLSTLHTDDGSVAVPGLVSAPAPEIDYPEDTLRADAGMLDGVRMLGTGGLAERLWTKPSLTVIGVDLPKVDVASNTLQGSVKAKLSMRLAAGQDPEEALQSLKTHLTESAPFGARVTFIDEETGKPWSAPADAPAMRLAHDAMTEAWGTPAVDIGIGGSIPFIADLIELFDDAEILVTGVEDPDSRAHSANESLHVPGFKKAILSEALLLRKLGSK
ncbi:dipeptidase [Spelaeicoccus albus]